MSRRAPGRHRAPRTSVLATILPTPTSASAVLPTQHAMRTTAVLLLTGGLAATGVVPAGADPAPVDGSSTSSEAPRDWSQRGADEESSQSADEPTPAPSPSTESEPAETTETEGDSSSQDEQERTEEAVTRTKSTRALAPRAARAKSVVNASRPMTVGAVSHASNLSGIRYVWGGTTTRGFDCSGFTRHVYRKLGVNLPRTAAAQQRATRRVSTPRPGDLVFFGRPAHHVGIYAGKGKMYDAPRRGKRTGLHKIWSSKVTYGRV